MAPSDEIVRLQQRASGLMRQGATLDAIAAYKELLASAPDLPESWFNLAWLQRQARDFEAAVASYAEAVRRGVSGPEEAHANSAAILSADLGRTQDAMDELRKALGLRPDYVPALLNLGNLQEDLGQRDAARDAYSRALEADPRNALALARLAGVSEVAGPEDRLVGQLELALAQPGLPAAARSDLGFALGRLLDSCAAYDAAFAAYEVANDAGRAAFGPGARSYDPAAAEAAISAIIEAFPASHAPPGEARDSRKAPIFICGMFRSGSTLAEQLLGQHPAIAPGGELDILPALVARHWPDFPEGAEGKGEDFFTGLRRDYLAELGLRISPGGWITDKRPDNFLFAGLIKRLFPEAKIVNTLRNPCDNALSIYFQLLGPHFAYATRLEDIAHWYKQYRRLAGHWRGIFGDDFHDLDYDRLVANPSGEVPPLLEFLGLPQDDRCLTPVGSQAVVRTASVWQVRQPLYRHASGRWRNYAAQMVKISGELGCTETGVT